MESSSAMASASPSMNLEEEVKCPICMEYLTDLVTLDCGHNFCRGCISQYCESWEDLGEEPGDLECPLCKAKIRRGNFRPNWQLASIAEKIKYLTLNQGREHLCVRHKEKLHLFCKEDQELVCLFCERSPEHQSHTVMLLEEVAKECKDQLCSCLEDLRKERERILASQAGTEEESQDLLGQIEERKISTVAVFQQLHQFLEDQRMLLLSQLEELEKEIATRRQEHMARLVKELSSLEGLIRHMEEKCQQPASELLLDIRRTLQRYEKKEAFGNPVAFPPELACRIGGFFDVKPLLEGVMEQFPANVTLDPDTAHPLLILSEDRKSVRWGDKRQALPYSPARFDTWPCVLGREGFTEGRHFWEVTVGSEGEWTVGVARKTLKRKGLFDHTPDEGIWAIGKWESQYIVFNSPDYTPLSMSQKLNWRGSSGSISRFFRKFQYENRVFNPLGSSPLPLSQELQRIRVTLDCAGGQVAFSDADTGVRLYTYSGASFCGETLLPFFWASGKAHLSLSS
ncbi:tripartite motif-containing protein 10-like [Tiliqua scincoides]|uniref:tripartite motif-containing protein 10-like n=1 Tax=Tiliqua scincoides TaxID=71010 RepID=UPI00346276B1